VVGPVKIEPALYPFEGHRLDLGDRGPRSDIEHASATIAVLLGVATRPATSTGAGGGPPVDLRGIVDGIRWVQQCKARWREAPARFGTPTTCWRWFSKWSESGVWGEIAGSLGAVETR
jgi:hypothetical protein